MKKCVCVLAVAWSVAWAGTSWAEGNKPESPLGLELDMVDGSHLIGIPGITNVSVQTSFALMSIPLAQIQTIGIGDDHESLELSLRNGDKLTGVITLKPIELATSFGKVSVGLEHIRKIRVTTTDSETREMLRKGLVLHYTFDKKEAGIVTDQSDKKNNGTVVGATFADGKNGGAYSLSGSHDHITAPNSDSLEIKDKLTLAIWVNLTSLNPGGYGNEVGYILNKGDDLWWNPAFSLGYGKGGGEPFFHVCNATDPQQGGGKSAGSAAKMELGKWYHLAGVYDGATVKLYVNGNLDKTEAYSGPLRSDKAPVHLGGGKLFGVDWGNNFTVNGLVDEVMIYNRALSDNEVRQLFIAQK